MSGTIDKTELLVLLQHAEGATVSPARVTSLMNELDTSGDGKMDLYEFLAILRAIRSVSTITIIMVVACRASCPPRGILPSHTVYIQAQLGIGHHQEDVRQGLVQDLRDQLKHHTHSP